MKQMKRWCSVLLVLCLFLAMIPVRAEAKTTITSPTGAKGSDYSAAYASKLDDIFQGRVPLFSDTKSTFALGQSLSNTSWYTVGGVLAGKQCYIYAQAVYYYLFGDIPYHGTGFSSEYWKDSKRIMTNRSSASYQSFVDAGVGFGAYIRTTQNSDGSFNAGVGHSMIVLAYDSTGITYLAGNANGSGLVRITTETWSEFNASQISGRARRICHIVQCNSANRAPATAALSMDKVSGKVGETFRFKSSADMLCSYELSIQDLDSGAYVIQDKVVPAAYEMTFEKPGHYSARVLARNAKGSAKSDSVEFWVFGAPPTKATVSANKTTMEAGDTVLLEAASDTDFSRYTMEILLYNDKNEGKKLFSSEISGSTSYKTTEKGIYKCRVKAWTHEASVYSDWVTLYVGTYTVDYDANGGSGAPSRQTKYYGKSLSLRAEKPVRTNYDFLGWAERADASKADYQPGSAYQKNANTKLYAVWKHICAEGHSYTYQLAMEPTAIAAGELKGTCSRCSGTTAVELPALSSNQYSYTVIESATCTAPGSGRYTWKNEAYGTYFFDCNVPALGHSCTAVVTAPTCTEWGYTTYTDCCGSSYVSGLTEPLGHSYAEGFCSHCGDLDPMEEPVEEETPAELTWTVSEDGILVISGEGEMENFSDAAQMPWYEMRDQISSVVIEAGVTTVGDYAFCGMSGLVSVEIASTVTSLGASAFRDCTALTELVIPESVTQIGEDCFLGCPFAEMIQ